MSQPLRAAEPYTDPFDPRVLFDGPQHPAPLWLNERRCALVDHEDHAVLVQWRWSEHFDQKGMLYVARLVGAWPGPRKRIFLHRAVMERVGPPPDEHHKYVDHKNGDTLDNRRENLRWATASMNAKNTWVWRLVHGLPT